MRRAKETASKRKNQSLGAKKVTGRSKRQNTKAVASSSGVINLGRTQKRREVFAGVVLTKRLPRTPANISAPTSDPFPASDPTPALDSAPAADPDFTPGPAPTPAPAPSPGPSSTPIRFNGGMIHSVLLQDTHAFEDVLNNPSSSRTDLKLKAAELRAISFREKTDVEGLARYINTRAEILDRLADELSNAGSSEEDDDMEDEEDDDEEGEEDDDDEEGGYEPYTDQEEEDDGDDDQEVEGGGESMVVGSDAEQDVDAGEEQTERVGGK